jgi:hypothetical protein
MAKPSQAPSANLTRRWGAGTAATVRLLVAADAPLSGVAIARMVGVTQPRASQIVSRLTASGVVEATPDGYVGLRAELMDLYARRSRPSLAGPESYWYSTRPPHEQALRIIEHAQGPVAFSADLGPDLLVPWRHPTVAIVYRATQLDPSLAGLVPAEGPADASVIVRWTTDPTLLSAATGWPASVEGIPLTDPLQQWVDLLDLGGDDRREAADRLRHAILTRAIGGPR